MGALMTKENKKGFRRERGICADPACKKPISRYEREELGGYCFSCYRDLEPPYQKHPEDNAGGII